MRWLLLVMTALALTSAEPTAETRHSLPVVGGTLAVDDLLTALAPELGLDPAAIPAHDGARLAVDTTIARFARAALEHGSDGIVVFHRVDDRLEVVVDRVRLRRASRAAHDQLRSLVLRCSPGANAVLAQRYGLRLPAGAVPDRLVVLVHGLDDPGRCWAVIAPALRADGHALAEFHYPNDQSVARSAAALANALAQARTAGVAEVDLVAHSLGGLVCRAALGVAPEQRPRLCRLITVGTPHAGSPLARWRLASEIRDQATRMLSGDGYLFGGILDGTGEAQEDLTPGSALLTALAAQPPPPGVAVTTIAGDRSPVSADGIDRLASWAGDAAPALRPALGELRATLTALADGHGDGAVGLESARWPGVTDHVVLHANHLTLLGRGESAALPIIRDRLARTQ